MTPELYNRLEQLFLEARALPVNRRAKFVDEVGRSEPDLRDELQLLLRFDDPGGLEVSGGADMLAGLLAKSQSAKDEGDIGPAPVLVGQIGRYTVIRQIGQGGMGTVYEAEQDNPRRRVALKVIRECVATPQAIRRFHREAQMLGRLCHRGIARIYDAHTSTDSEAPPYFVMELVEGLPLLKFAESERLDRRQRLELIAEICDALEYAHRSGLVHRDLKPGNILVETSNLCGAGTGECDSIQARSGGQPKILDFGIARDDDARTLTQTDSGRVIGTIPYMSPEQAVGEVLDARSDIYSMGVIAFELLVGRLPYDVACKMLHEAAWIIRNEEPLRLGSIDRRLRGDVEIIVGKALEKDRDRRYAAAADFAADIRRHLCDLPIVAHRSSAAYRLRMRMKRRKSLWAGIAIAAATAITAAAVTTVHVAAARGAKKEETRYKLAASSEAWSRYVGAVGAASDAIDNINPDVAAKFLDAAGEDLRGWEHSYLAARLATYGPVIEVGSPIAASAFRSDGSIVTASASGLIQTWNGASARLLHQVRLSLEITGPAAFSADGRLLVGAVGPGANSVALWDCADGAEIACLSGAEIALALGSVDAASVTRIAISSDGEKVVLGGSSCSLWNPRTGVLRVWANGIRVQALAFCPDESHFICAFRRPNVTLHAFVQKINFWTGQLVDREIHIPYSVLCLAAAEGNMALIGTSANGAKFGGFDLGNKAPVYGPDRQASAVAVDPRSFRPHTSQLVAVASGDLVRVFSRRSRSLIRSFAAPAAQVTQLEFSPDAAWLLAVAGSSARRYQMHPIDAVTFVRSPDAGAVDFAFTGDSRLISVGEDGTACRWEAPWDSAGAAFSLSGGAPDFIAFAPCGSLITAHANGRFHFLSADDGSPSGSIDVGSEELILSIAASDGGARIAARTLARLVLLDTTLSRPLWTTLFASPAAPLAISLDGMRIASAAPDGVQIWDSQGNSVAELFDAGAVESLAFSPDASRLVCGLTDGRLNVWDLRSRSPHATLSAHGAAVRAITFTPDGTRAATASDDRRVLIWDTQRWQPVLTLQTKHVVAVRFSPDGSTLAGRLADGTIQVWDSRR